MRETPPDGVSAAAAFTSASRALRAASTVPIFFARLSGACFTSRSMASCCRTSPATALAQALRSERRRGATAKADDHDGVAAEAPQATDDGVVLSEQEVAGQRCEVLDPPGGVALDGRPVRAERPLARGGGGR